jgi:hypothetical protein
MPVPLIIYKGAIEADLLKVLDDVELLYREHEAYGDPLGIANDLRSAYEALFRVRVRVDETR